MIALFLSSHGNFKGYLNMLLFPTLIFFFLGQILFEVVGCKRKTLFSDFKS